MATDNKPRGWASLTRRHLDPQAPADPFPSLGVAVPPGPSRLGSEATLRAPFVAVASKGLRAASGGGRTRELGLGNEDVAVAKLREQHGWAEEVLVRDVLRTVDGDEGVAGAQLVAMAGPEEPSRARAGAGAGEEMDGVVGDESRPFECKERSDVYLKSRREALRLSRVSGKYARGAYNAYMAGDHTHARQFSREARENFKNAEKLHDQAAGEILSSRNADGHGNVWSIDLHGLHTTEAVAALRERLAHIEKELATNPAFLYSQRQRTPEYEQPLPLSASRACVKNELSVITGVGRHSKGGPSLPLAVKNFLLAEGYKFSEPRPGAVAVTPKRRYT